MITDKILFNESCMMVGRFLFFKKKSVDMFFSTISMFEEKIAIDREFTKSPNFFVHNTMKTNSNVFNFCAYYGKFGTDNF